MESDLALKQALSGYIENMMKSKVSSSAGASVAVIATTIVPTQ
jgi:hypothetical protein